MTNENIVINYLVDRIRNEDQSQMVENYLLLSVDLNRLVLLIKDNPTYTNIPSGWKKDATLADDLIGLIDWIQQQIDSQDWDQVEWDLETLYDELSRSKTENTSMNPQLITDTHDQDVEDVATTAEAAKTFLKSGEYEKVLDNLNHIVYLTQYL